MPLRLVQYLGLCGESQYTMEYLSNITSFLLIWIFAISPVIYLALTCQFLYIVILIMDIGSVIMLNLKKKKEVMMAY
jgi:hypothetical protein